MKQELLLNIPIFNDLKDSTLELLKEKAFKINLKRKQRLFSVGDKVETLYIVLHGKVTMYRNTEEGQKKIVYILEQGQIINEVILDGKPASITCEAFEDSCVLGFRKEDFMEIMEQDFQLTKAVIFMMSKKIRRLYRQLKNTVPLRMDKRVAAKLWKLSKDYGVEVEDGTLIDLKITITYLAEMLGSPRESISRCIKLLQDEGYVKYNKRRMIVKQEELAKYYRGLE